MIAAVCPWHAHHRSGHREIHRRLARGDQMAVAAPCAIEFYAVLTRLPAPHRLAARDAFNLIKTNFKTSARTVGLSPGELWDVLDRLHRLGLGGGLTYDAIVLDCARKAGAAELLTFNARDFLRLEPGDVNVVVPGTRPCLS